MRSIFCGNLNYKLTEAELRAVFKSFGQVDGARIIVDKWTNEAKGFGFVDMASEDDAARAMAALEGTILMGRRLRCSPASRERAR